MTYVNHAVRLPLLPQRGADYRVPFGSVRSYEEHEENGGRVAPDLEAEATLALDDARA